MTMPNPVPLREARTTRGERRGRYGLRRARRAGMLRTGNGVHMSLFNRVSKFAKSPQGKKMMNRAQTLAKDPKTKEKISEARERLTHKDKAGKPQAPGSPPAEETPAKANPPGATS